MAFLINCLYLQYLSVPPSSSYLNPSQSFSHPSVDVRQAACDSVGAVLNPSDPLLQDIVPLLLVSAQEKNTAIKAAAEGALLELFKEPDRLKVKLFAIV